MPTDMPRADAQIKSRLDGGLRALGRSVLDIFVPPVSPISGQAVGAAHTLTPHEWGQLRQITAPQCACCGVPFPYDMGADAFCLRCTAEQPPYKVARSAVAYDGAGKDLVLAFKHADRLDAAPLMSHLMAQAGADVLRDATHLIPVPLHRWRLLARRYNQAAVLAHALARSHGIAVAANVLVRTRATESQGHKTRQQRFDNVRGVFAVRRAIADARVVLIDDVMTTGATVEACTKALLKAGAADVRVLTFSRVLQSDI